MDQRPAGEQSGPDELAPTPLDGKSLRGTWDRFERAVHLLGFSRGHWSIENGVFYVRDEAFGEDRIRRRSGPQVLAAFRNTALNILRLTGSTNIAASLRSCTWNLQHVLNLLGIMK